MKLNKKKYFFTSQRQTLPAVQNHNPRRSGQHDRSRTVGSASHNGEGISQHSFLPNLQLRDAYHRTTDLSLHKVQIQAARREEDHRKTGADLRSGKFESGQSRAH